MRFIAPDDGNADDRTVMAVPLPRAVAPRRDRSTVEIDVDGASAAHRSRAPARSATTTSSRSGSRSSACSRTRGWNSHQFHAATEFYADYGVYDVRMTVPRGWVVGATGPRARTHATTPTARRRTATAARTSTTSPGRRAPTIVERRRTFEHPTLPRVEMRLLLQPEHAGQADRHFDGDRARR